ncbi:MAG: hypothetical protein D3910_22010, partial [Candidatus Electrothrix sp. ATG2]|nr:hypothetical protein [Candidatus Electrothrix sp. ATG2]
AESLLLTEQGRILVAGTYREGENAALMVLGYDENGDLDTSFGYEGVTVPLDGTVPSAGYGMAVRNDGSILVAGSVGEEGSRDAALFLFSADGLPDREFGDRGVLLTDDDKDTVLYDTLVTEEMIAATGVTVGEDDKREALLITYSKKDEANSELFQQQMAETATGVADEEEGNTGPVVEVVTTEMDNQENSASSLAAVGPGSVVVVGSSGAPEIASASVHQYTVFHSSVSGSSWGTATGNANIWIGEAYDVTRTTALIRVDISEGIGEVSERGVVFSTEPLPVFNSSDSSTDDDEEDKDTDDEETADDDADSEIDETPPEIKSSTESLFSTTEPVILSVTTNEDATCKFNKDYDEDYSQMVGVLSDSAGTGHSLSLGLMPETDEGNDYTFYIRCKDEEGNTNTAGEKISFPVSTDTSGTAASTADDTTPPIITNQTDAVHKSGEDVLLSLTTNETAECRYDSDEDKKFTSMSNGSFALT